MEKAQGKPATGQAGGSQGAECRPQLQVPSGGGQAGGEAWEASRPETKRLSGFISPVSRVVDGAIVIGVVSAPRGAARSDLPWP